MRHRLVAMLREGMGREPSPTAAVIDMPLSAESDQARRPWKPAVHAATTLPRK